MMDNPTMALAGKTVWNVAEWLEATCDGLPYEIFTEPGDAEQYGYRLTVERIPGAEHVVLAGDAPTGPKHGLTCRACEGDIATCGCWDG